jgi:hypothetical protein
VDWQTMMIFRNSAQVEAALSPCGYARKGAPFVLIVTPAPADIRPITVGCLARVLLFHGREQVAYSPALAPPVVAQNEAAAAILANKQFTHLMLIDSDMTFPPTALRDLLARNTDIVGGVYRARQEPHPRFFFPLDDADRDRESGIVLARSLPTGMMLIRRRVFEAMTYPYFFFTYGSTPDDGESQDTNFCYQARALGFGFFADLDVSRQIEHLAEEGLKW